MRPVRRSGVNKGRSAAKFRRSTTRAKALNFKPAVMRGGIRL